MRRLIQMLCVPAVVALVTLTSTSQAHTQTLQPELEQRVLTLINQHRAGLGRPALVHHAQLRQAARAYALVLARLETTVMEHSHDGKPYTQRIREAGFIPSGMTAENIVWNYGNSRPADSAVSIWLGSAPHKVNIENATFNLTGIGGYRSAGGKYYFCQVFAQGTAPTSTGTTPSYVRTLTVENQTRRTLRFYIESNVLGRTGKSYHTLVAGQTQTYNISPFTFRIGALDYNGVKYRGTAIIRSRKLTARLTQGWAVSRPGFSEQGWEVGWTPGY